MIVFFLFTCIAAVSFVLETSDVAHRCICLCRAFLHRSDGVILTCILNLSPIVVSCMPLIVETLQYHTEVFLHIIFMRIAHYDSTVMPCKSLTSLPRISCAIDRHFLSSINSLHLILGVT